MKPQIERLCRAYEENRVPGLEALRTQWAKQDPAQLVDALVDERAEVPATWMLLDLLKAGLELEANATAALMRRVERVTAPDARLHLCQSVRFLSVPKRNREQLARFLRSGLEGEVKFVRAWALDGMCALAQQHSDFAQEASRTLARAASDPAASVRARARRLLSDRSFESR